MGISGRNAQAIRGSPTVLVVSRACSAVGKGRQSRDAGEQVILANGAPFHWDAWKTVELVPWGEGSPEQGIKSPAPIYPVWKLLPLPTASACPKGGHMCLWPGKPGLHGGRPGEQVEPLCCSVPREGGPYPSPGSALGQDGCTDLVSCPGSSPCERRVGRMGAFWEGSGEGCQHTPPTPPSLPGAGQGCPSLCR